ncbi:MAG: xanthine dehydrogenase family protein molybdopterin-binding subunit [bacterium]
MAERRFATIGGSAPVVDGPAKAAGRTRYIQDIYLPRMLHAKMVFAGRPHARIRGISFEGALAAGGVAVAWAESVPGKNRVGVVVDDQPLFAHEKVRYQGDCVAVVGADSAAAAERAARAVRVDYEDLPCVATAEAADRPGATAVHDGGNLAVEHRVVRGDVARGESESDLVVEDVFFSPVQEHGYLETQSAVAIPSADGSMEILASTQCPFYVRDAVARCLGLPLSRVRVLQMPIGGGFGGKEDVPSEICARAAVLAAATRRPVRMVLSREDDIAHSSKRHPMELRYRMGAGRDGRLKFADIEIRADVGAYATLSPIVLYRATVHAAGPYEIPHVRVRSRGFYTNTAPKGAMRGFGTPQVVFACEAAIDEIAARAGIDGIEFRLRNALKVGSATATGQVLEESVGFSETLLRARDLVEGDPDAFRPRTVRKDVVRAKGVASMYYGVSLGAIGRGLDRGTAKVEILKDGSVSVFIGCTDMGQGASTVIGQIASEALGVDPRLVTVNPVDTSAVPDSGPTVASRTTVMSGNAVIDACAKLRARILEVASSVLGETAGFEPGTGRIAGRSGGRSLSMAEAILECAARKTDLAATGWYNPPDCSVDAATGEGKAYNVYSFATDIAEVEVDVRTGHVDVVGAWAVHDSGTIVNRLTAASQVEGGIAQGVGLAARERFSESEGRVGSADFSTYLMPTALDVCDRVRVEFVECGSREGPFGAKGLGEPAIIPVAAAVANAISNAVGARVKSLPVSPEWVADVAGSRRDR